MSGCASMVGSSSEEPGAVIDGPASDPPSDNGDDPVEPNLRYLPDWALLEPSCEQSLDYDDQLTAEENGNRLTAAVANLQPGCRLQVAAGRYDLNASLVIEAEGTVDQPIWIQGREPHQSSVELNGAGLSDYVVKIGDSASSTTTRYVYFGGFEIFDGQGGVGVEKASHVAIHQNHIHDVSFNGVGAHSNNIQSLYIVNNKIHGISGSGKGIRLGNDYYSVADSTIALNEIYDTLQSNSGDGIDMRWGCSNNWIVENHIYSTSLPALRVHGSRERAINLIERNYLHDSEDNIVQFERGDAVFRNNIVVGGVGNAALDSTHNGNDSLPEDQQTKNLYITHNTVMAANGYGVELFGWNGQDENLYFTNNVSYVPGNWGHAFALPMGEAGGNVFGNVFYGIVRYDGGGYIMGNGLSDFENLSDFPDWDNQLTDLNQLRPALNSIIIGSGQVEYAEEFDFFGEARTLPVEAGCFDVR